MWDAARVCGWYPSHLPRKGHSIASVARPSERRCRSHIPSVILRTRTRIFTCAHVVNPRSFHSGSCRCMQWSGAVAELTTGAALLAHYSDGSHRNVNAIYGSKLASKKVTIKAKQSIQTTEPGYVASDNTTCRRCRCWLTSFFLKQASWKKDPRLPMYGSYSSCRYDWFRVVEENLGVLSSIS